MGKTKVPEIIPAERSHIPEISRRVRCADRRELWAAYCRTPDQVLQDSLHRSVQAWTGTINGVPVCMFGVVAGSFLGEIGAPWMVGTELLDENAMIFLRRCRECVARMLEHFPVLINYVDQGNTRAIQWLMWMGFKVTIPGEPMGHLDLPFCKFELSRGKQ